MKFFALSQIIITNFGRCSIFLSVNTIRSENRLSTTWGTEHRFTEKTSIISCFKRRIGLKDISRFVSVLLALKVKLAMASSAKILSPNLPEMFSQNDQKSKTFRMDDVKTKTGQICHETRSIELHVERKTRPLQSALVHKILQMPILHGLSVLNGHSSPEKPRDNNGWWLCFRPAVHSDVAAFTSRDADRRLSV